MLVLSGKHKVEIIVLLFVDHEIISGGMLYTEKHA